MGLFSKSEACPVCGGEVKGLFLTKIADKKILCKNCSRQISMNKELVKTATPDFIKEHLAYRKKNAERFAAAFWDMEYKPFNLKVGVDRIQKLLYIGHDQLNTEDNPVVFSFDQITGYELYRLKKRVDSDQEPGGTALESGLTVLAGLSKMTGSGDSNNTDYFKICLTTTDPYWPTIELKLMFSGNMLYGSLGVRGEADDLKGACQAFKHIVRKELV